MRTAQCRLPRPARASRRTGKLWTTSRPRRPARSVSTLGSLSGGESQRIRLASQIGSGLTGVLYVLDEPSIGLHQRDNARLLDTLKRLRDLGDTVIVVEHDEDAILTADYVLDIGPGAGIHGGHIVAEGTPRIDRPAEIIDRRLSFGRTAAAIRRRRRNKRRTLKRHQCARQQPEEHHRRDSARPVHLRHRRFGRGKSDSVIDTLTRRARAN